MKGSALQGLGIDALGIMVLVITKCGLCGCFGFEGCQNICQKVHLPSGAEVESILDQFLFNRCLNRID